MTIHGNVPPALDIDDAMRAIIKLLKSGQGKSPGYDLWLNKVVEDFLISVHGMTDHGARSLVAMKISPIFYAAAWELCLRGIIRPGILNFQSDVGDGGKATGYCITPRGQAWLAVGTEDFESMPGDPGRFASMLDHVSSRFGPAFKERAREAHTCLWSRAHLACCAMCGAGAEAVILATAIAKTGDESATIKEYLSSGGRRRIESKLLGSQPEDIRRMFLSFTSLLNYWRDGAAHGAAVQVGDDEAFTALAMLLRFALFVDARWVELTK